MSNNEDPASAPVVGYNFAGQASRSHDGASDDCGDRPQIIAETSGRRSRKRKSKDLVQNSKRSLPRPGVGPGFSTLLRLRSEWHLQMVSGILRFHHINSRSMLKP